MVLDGCSMVLDGCSMVLDGCSMGARWVLDGARWVLDGCLMVDELAASAVPGHQVWTGFGPEQKHRKACCPSEQFCSHGAVSV
eukprot:5486605-Alexandrium_andersonii.AAC.1